MISKPAAPSDPEDLGSWYLIRRKLERLRMLGKEYLHHKGERPAPPAEAEAGRPPPPRTQAGLWLRDQDEVLGRIKNLVLLFDPGDFIDELKEAGKAGKKRVSVDTGPFEGLTSYDLFYYLRSLI